jgi:hypothetical protein
MTKKQTPNKWPGPSTMYCRWNTDDEESQFPEAYANMDDLSDKDGEVVGVYELVGVKRVYVRPALVELTSATRKAK